MESDVKYKQLRPLWSFLHRYHAVLFVVIVLGSLAAATFFLSRTISDSSQVSNTNTSTSFDETTIKKINALKTIDEQEIDPSSAPRSARNPFTE